MTKLAGERSWKLALKNEEDWKSGLDRTEGAPKRPFEKLRVTASYGFNIELSGLVTREFRRNLSIRRFAKEDRAGVQYHFGEWMEPSAHLDAIVADFRHELELALRDAMPWDDEL